MDVLVKYNLGKSTGSQPVGEEARPERRKPGLDSVGVKETVEGVHQKSGKMGAHQLLKLVPGITAGKRWRL